MSAISDIREKELSTWTNAEKCFVELWEQMGFEDMAENAAADFTAMQERIEKLEKVRKAAQSHMDFHGKPKGMSKTNDDLLTALAECGK